MSDTETTFPAGHVWPMSVAWPVAAPLEPYIAMGCTVTVATVPLTAYEVETVRQLVEQGYLPGQADRLARILGGLKPVTA